MRLLLVALLLILAAPATAADDDSAAWAIVSGSGRFEPDGRETPWRYSLDAAWRNFDRGPGLDQYVLGGSVGYDLNPAMTLWAGYTYYLSDPGAGSDHNEHRLMQQFQWQAARWDWGKLSLRARLEQRFREHSDDTGLRLRQQVALAVPVTAYDVTLLVSTEHFTNLNDTDYGALSGFDQLRSYLGFRMPMTERAALDAGYMHQWINRSGSEDRVNHTAMLQLRLAF